MAAKLTGSMESARAYAFTDYIGNGEEFIDHIRDFQRMGNIPQGLNFNLIYDRLTQDFDSARLNLPSSIIDLASSIRLYNSEMCKVDAISLRYAVSLEKPEAVYSNSINETGRAHINRNVALSLRDALVLVKGNLLGSIVLYKGKDGSAQRYSLNRTGR